MKKYSLLATASLFLTAAIWGLSYSAQAEAAKTMPTLSFVFLRYLIGSVMLLPGILVMRRPPDKSLQSAQWFCG